MSGICDGTGRKKKKQIVEESQGFLNPCLFEMNFDVKLEEMVSGSDELDEIYMQNAGLNAPLIHL